MELTKLPFEYKGEKIRNALCIAKTEDVAVLRANQILSNREANKYNSFKTESGKVQYLLGRYSAKQAYIKLTSNDDIEIKNGIFEQPILNNAEFDVSIAHTDGIGAAIVFDKAFPIGIDVEIIDSSKTDALKKMTKQAEIENIRSDETTTLTIAWCLKEALSKALKTGLTIPLELLKIDVITENNDCFLCEFTNFSQYKAMGQIEDNYAWAIAYPQQLNVIGAI